MGILSQLELEHSEQDIEQFLHFFRALCDNFEPLILKLANTQSYKNALEELVKLAHNTAWGARRLELSEVLDFCVFCEEMLECALKFDGPASDEFMDWLLLVSDQLEKYYLSYENDAFSLAIFNPLIVNVPSIISK